MWIKEWNPSFSVSVKKFDEQHRKIFELLNQLYEALKTGEGSRIILDILQSLISYTDTHFVEEEQMMQSIDYPGIGQQKQQHKELLDHILELKQKFISGDSDLVPVNTLSFLNSWLVNHIQIEDKKYAQFFNAKGVF